MGLLYAQAITILQPMVIIENFIELIEIDVSNDLPGKR